MSDNIMEADEVQRAQHHGQDGPAPERANPEQTPEAVEEQSLRQRVTQGAGKSRFSDGRETRWVRAGELLSGASGRLAGHGIALTRTIHRAPRDLLLASARRGSTSAPIESDRISRLAPIQTFGDGRANSTASLGLRR
jgi:hypothetical protein